MVIPVRSQGLVALSDMVLAPAIAPGPGTLTVKVLVPWPDVIVKPAGTVQV